MEPGYDHTQTAPLHWILWAVGIFVAGIGVFTQAAIGWLICGLIALLMFLVSMMFQWLRVYDDGSHLRLCYGPLPLFRASFAYEQITDVERARSSVVDGWGIHYLPFRGTTYNLWGLDCVKMRVNGRVVRIGSDDAAGLAQFLQARLAGAEREL